jgi:hypothetical protein
VKKKEEEIYGHTESVHVETTDELLKLPQSEKWLHAQCKAPAWKKDEYAAQSLAWEESPKLHSWKFFSDSPKKLEEMPIPWEQMDTSGIWCNPLARA